MTWNFAEYVTDYKNTLLHNYKRLFGAMENAIISTNSYIFKHWHGNLLRDSDLPFSSQLSKDSEWMCKYPLRCPHNKILFCKETEVYQFKYYQTLRAESPSFLEKSKETLLAGYYYQRNKFRQPVTTA